MESSAILLEKFERHLSEMLKGEKWSSPLYEPGAYILSMGGKRVRPLLVMLAYQAVAGKSGSKALNAAVAVEVFHNFTLIHDDILDAAPMRRNQKTVHEKWNLKTAILVGDALFALSIEMLVRDFPAEAARLMKEFSDMAAGVCEGQSEDMEMQGKLEVNISDYIGMIRKKTALLIGSSLKLGAMASGADSNVCDSFYRWGIASGLGFQLRDDYLDAFGDERRLGKQPGGDILQNKMTYLVLKAWEKANSEQRERLKNNLFVEENPEVKVKSVLALFEELDVKSDIEVEMQKQFSLADQAGAELSHFEGSAEIQKLFADLKTRES